MVGGLSLFEKKLDQPIASSSLILPSVPNNCSSYFVVYMITEDIPLS
jgi:hypothetical protein